jgi:hypothetical protein
MAHLLVQGLDWFTHCAFALSFRGSITSFPLSQFSQYEGRTGASCAVCVCMYVCMHAQVKVHADKCMKEKALVGASICECPHMRSYGYVYVYEDVLWMAQARAV